NQRSRAILGGEIAGTAGATLR
ncbi:2-polyprenylphenol 6-hydroxylase, partial [Vibrio parahaemolyticus V-223/04]